MWQRIRWWFYDAQFKLEELGKDLYCKFFGHGKPIEKMSSTYSLCSRCYTELRN